LTTNPRVAAPAAPLPPLTLVLGGARSGKSRHAESLIEASGLARVYIATAQALDAEMTERIRHHRERRAGAGWTTIEASLDLAGALAAAARPGCAVLVDCLTLWLTNVLLRAEEGGGLDVAAEIAALAGRLPRLEGPVVLVANEVGLGIVPDNALARAFRDHAGRLNQAVAAAAQRVVFVAAGLPLVLKDDIRSR
jgi:adenosylcobinamide kinase/adenosylcobinamide-phosphate guanylyltransferase